MGNKEYAEFEEHYLGKFKKYYKECINYKQKRELKRSIYENNNLTKTQKDRFWEKVTK